MKKVWSLNGSLDSVNWGILLLWAGAFGFAWVSVESLVGYLAGVFFVLLSLMLGSRDE